MKKKIEAAGENGIHSVADLKLPEMSLDYGDYLVRFIDADKKERGEDWFDINRIGLAHGLAGKPIHAELDKSFYANN